MASSTYEKLSLSKILSKKTAVELRKMARGFYVRGSSAMRKEALVSSVFSALLVPERLEELLYVIDDETWTLFQTAYKEEFISLSGRLPDNFMLLKELCYLVQEPNSYEQIVYTMLFEMTVATSFAVPLGKPLQFVYAEHGT